MVSNEVFSLCKSRGLLLYSDIITVKLNAKEGKLDKTKNNYNRIQTVDILK